MMRLFFVILFMPLFLLGCGNREEEQYENDLFPESEIVEQHEVTDDFRVHMALLLEFYQVIADAMYDNNKAAREDAIHQFKQALIAVSKADMSRGAKAEWENLVVMLTEEAENMLQSTENIALEAYFYALSDILTTAIERYGTPVAVYRYFCQEAFNGSGAAWLSLRNEIRNPYRSQNLSGCGVLEMSF